MRAHVVENGLVVNTIEVQSLDFMPCLVEANAGSIGWLFDGNAFTDPNHQKQEQRDAEKALSVRVMRNAKLTLSDWTQVADAPVDQAVWATYRQALRDMTSQPGFPYEVQWPIQPE